VEFFDPLQGFSLGQTRVKCGASLFAEGLQVAGLAPDIVLLAVVQEAAVGQLES
jgi:hypothetical protein